MDDYHEEMKLWLEDMCRYPKWIRTLADLDEYVTRDRVNPPKPKFEQPYSQAELDKINRSYG